MTKQEFHNLLLQSSKAAFDFAKNYVLDELPEDFKYTVKLNISSDDPDLKQFDVYPEDNDKVIEVITVEEAVDILYRKCKVPVWIDISVAYKNKDQTVFTLLCAGRYSDNESEFYYQKQGTGPFGIKSPNFPPGFDPKSGDKFKLTKKSTSKKIKTNENLIKQLEEATKKPLPKTKPPEEKENKTNENSEEKKDSKDESFDYHALFAFIAIVFVIILIIVSLGTLFKNYRKSKYEHFEEAEIVEDELEIKKRELVEAETLIAHLDLKKQEIQRKEKKYLIWARIGIGFIMLLINCWFYDNYILWNNTFELNKIVTLNSFILLLYSFAAFLLYGTPANLVAALKSIITNYLTKKNIDTFTELEELMQKRDILLKEIEILEKRR